MKISLASVLLLTTLSGCGQPRGNGAASGVPQVGQDGVVRAKSDGDVPCFPTEDDWKRGGQLSTAKDLEGLQAMALSGKLVMLGAGTPVRVIDLGFLCTEIRVSSGPHAGQALFVSSEFVRRE